MRLYFVLLILIFSSSAVAQESTVDYEVNETWRCFALFDYQKKTLVLLTRQMVVGGKLVSATVEVAGTKYKAVFRLNGFNRRWSFMGDKYSFIITPQGDGSYYDFTRTKEGESVSSSQRYECEMS